MRCMAHTGQVEKSEPDVVMLEEAMQMDPTAGDMMRVLAHLVAPRVKMRQKLLTIRGVPTYLPWPSSFAQAKRRCQIGRDGRWR
jgi:hypothetical protein